MCGGVGGPSSTAAARFFTWREWRDRVARLGGGSDPHLGLCASRRRREHAAPVWQDRREHDTYLPSTHEKRYWSVDASWRAAHHAQLLRPGAWLDVDWFGGTRLAASPIALVRHCHIADKGNGCRGVPSRFHGGWTRNVAR